MTSQAFHDSLDRLTPHTGSALRRTIFIGLAMLSISFLGICFLATKGFSKGTIADLGADERHVLDTMTESGILVREEPIPCTMSPHVVIEVVWVRQLSRYCVTGMEMRNVDIESVAPYIRDLPGMHTISEPCLTDQKRAKIAKLLPHLQVLSSH